MPGGLEPDVEILRGNRLPKFVVKGYGLDKGGHIPSK